MLTSPKAAADSSTYVLSRHSLRRIADGGRLLFAVSLPFTLAARHPGWLGPLVFPDSTAALTNGEDQLTGFTHRGDVAWRLRLPSGARLREAPIIAPSGSLYVYTTAGLMVVGSDGSLRWTLRDDQLATRSTR